MCLRPLNPREPCRLMDVSSSCSYPRVILHYICTPAQTNPRHGRVSPTGNGIRRTWDSGDTIRNRRSRRAYVRPFYDNIGTWHASLVLSFRGFRITLSSEAYAGWTSSSPTPIEPST